MKNRTIKSIVYAATFDMGGMPVRQAFPSAKAEALDPFLLLHHADIKVPTHLPVDQAGVGPHPHRGFSPVTFIFKGGVHHRDSRGNDNVIYEGGMQWMNAGMGIIHSERPPHDLFEKGGRQEIIQLWVNTPAAHKMDQPAYFSLPAEETPVILSEDGLVRVSIHSGELSGTKSPTPTHSAVNTYTMSIRKGGKFYFNIPPTHNAFIYLLDGKINIANDGTLEGKYVAILNNNGDGFEIEAQEDTRAIIGSGEPINEPIASHGPFVMNTQTELMEAFRDYQVGKMGVLIEETPTAQAKTELSI
jgi:redox-sensitive bicupin YhaK (pirin superfamily)